jgi:hypothetical protein
MVVNGTEVMCGGWLFCTVSVNVCRAALPAGSVA